MTTQHYRPAAERSLQIYQAPAVQHTCIAKMQKDKDGSNLVTAFYQCYIREREVQYCTFGRSQLSNLFDLNMSLGILSKRQMSYRAFFIVLSIFLSNNFKQINNLNFCNLLFGNYSYKFSQTQKVSSQNDLVYWLILKILAFYENNQFYQGKLV